MNTQKVMVYFISLVGFIGSCNVYDLEDTIEAGLDDIDYICYDSTSNYFFRGVIGEDSICVYDKSNNYVANFGQGSGFVTLKPFFNTEDFLNTESKTWVDCALFKTRRISSTQVKVIEEFRIKTQPMKFDTPMDSMVRAFLIPGIHKVRAKVNNDSISVEGFEVILKNYYENSKLNPDHRTIDLTSVLGFQPSDSFVKILEVDLEQHGNMVEGYLHLTFSCNMYLNNAGKLTGDFVDTFSGEFSLPISYRL